MQRAKAALFCIVVSACGGAAPRVPPASPSPAVVAPTTAAPASIFPMPRARLVAQHVPSIGEAPEVHALADGTLVILGDGVLVRTDASLHVVRRVAIPHLAPRTLVARDEAWERVVTSDAYVETRTGTRR